MTQIKVSKILELAKFTQTEAGKQLQDFLQYVSELADQVIRILRNGITIQDNVDAKWLDVTLVTGVATVVNVGSRRAKMITVAQVVSVLYGLDAFSWYVDTDGSTKVKATLTGSPGTAQVPVVLLVCYG